MSGPRARHQERWAAHNAELQLAYTRSATLVVDRPPASCPVGQENHPIAGFCKSLRGQKRVGLLNEQKEEERVPIESIGDLFKHAEQIKATVRRYDAQRKAPRRSRPE